MQAFTDPRGAAEASFNENLRRQFEDLATEGERAAFALYEVAAKADFFAKRLEADTRTSEGLANTVFSALGGGRVFEDYSRSFANRQARVDAAGESPFNRAFLEFSQRATESNIIMQRAIEDATKKADNDVKANTELQKFIRENAALEIAAIDKQADAETRKFDALIDGQRQQMQLAQEQVAFTEKLLQETTRAFDANNAFVKGFALSDASSLSPTQRYAEARKQFDTQFTLAQTDRSAAAGFPELAQALLRESRNVNASGVGYRADELDALKKAGMLVDKYGALQNDETRLRDAQLEGVKQATRTADYLAELKATTLAEFDARKSSISKDAEFQAGKLDAINASIRDDLPRVIAQLTEDNQKRIEADPFYSYFRQFVESGRTDPLFRYPQDPYAASNYDTMPAVVVSQSNAQPDNEALISAIGALQTEVAALKTQLTTIAGNTAATASATAAGSEAFKGAVGTLVDSVDNVGYELGRIRDRPPVYN